MKAAALYGQLEKDFVQPGITEDWYLYGMSEIAQYICDNFKQRSMGLLCDFADEIHKVYTAVFPSDLVLRKIAEDNVMDAMLFLHHPQDWALNREPNKAFYQMNSELLERLRKNRVSLYNFHYPLDNYGPYSTSVTLTNALGIAVKRPFAASDGALCGVIGITDCKDIYALQAKYAQAVGHETKLYAYGDGAIRRQRVGICAGGGNDVSVVRELIENDINVLITGISLHNARSSEVHSLEQAHGIYLLGGTHYSSEKFACMAMCDYFRKLGLPSEFVPDLPCIEDM
ncbi:MAG: Nif3-like dinuclear metal center hexameric protein [Clostridiales bacterium]|nr:Nif3-like dinuclear metal center hexameric protein [Clostridiales bacterium]